MLAAKCGSLAGKNWRRRGKGRVDEGGVLAIRGPHRTESGCRWQGSRHTGGGKIVYLETAGEGGARQTAETVVQG